MKRSGEASMEEEEKKEIGSYSPQTPAATPSRSFSELYEHKRRKKQIAPITPSVEHDFLRGQHSAAAWRKKCADELLARRDKIRKSLHGMSSVNLVSSLSAGVKTAPSKFSECLVNKQVAGIGNQGVTNLGDGHDTKKAYPIVVLDLDTDEEDLHVSSPAKGVKPEELNEQFTTPSDQGVTNLGDGHDTKKACPIVVLDLDTDEEDLNVSSLAKGVKSEELNEQCTTPSDQASNNVEGQVYENSRPFCADEGADNPSEAVSSVEYDNSLKKEATLKKDKGVYVGVEDDMAEEGRYHRNDAEDNLEDIWKEMEFAFECSKEVDVDPSPVEQVREIAKDCDHSFVLKDDLGYVCRVCGIIQKGIETIFEFVYSKGKKSTRTYMTEPQKRKHGESNKASSLKDKFPEDDMTVTEINAHPRHRKEMRAHQLEGFKFLQSNLFSDTPGGCILAHAPGSGKTFLIISFIQSFLATYPEARPLIVLPKGILSTWKKEFQKWQVEDIPLHDFYTSKADSRSQQLDVLKSWVNERSILFLGFKQVSSIMCDYGSNDVTIQCQEILLRGPTILILDEGHTSRNDETDVFQSLAKVHTPRKVVLSGTLYQNHVKEVFNILNLVCPRFLKSMASQEIHKRIMSRVQIDGVRKKLKGNSESAFFDLVEHALTKDENRTRTEAVIEDLREMTHKILHYYKGDFLEELPGLVDFTVVLNLSHKQKAEVPYLLKLERFKSISEGVAIYMHPNLKNSSGDLPSDDVKMDKVLKEMDPKDGVKMKFFIKLLRLCESTGEKLLVFSQFITPLKLLERFTVTSKGWTLGKEIFLLTGDTKSEIRESFMDTFNNSPHAKVFFGSIKACGEGISLVGASRILILDVHLNPSVTRQAIGRAFRPGQKNKVYTYRLVAADSPEEEHHLTSFRKELVSKRWFEWNARCGPDHFELKSMDVNDCDDPFFENSTLGEDLKVLYKR